MLKMSGYIIIYSAYVNLFLLCIYGSFTFIFSDIYSHGDEPIVNTEQMLNIDIPTHSRINTQDWTKGTQSVFVLCFVEKWWKTQKNAEKILINSPNRLIVGVLMDLLKFTY